jgi:hypothetical protein
MMSHKLRSLLQQYGLVARSLSNNLRWNIYKRNNKKKTKKKKTTTTKPRMPMSGKAANEGDGGRPAPHPPRVMATPTTPTARPIDLPVITATSDSSPPRRSRSSPSPS